MAPTAQPGPYAFCVCQFELHEDAGLGVGEQAGDADREDQQGDCKGFGHLFSCAGGNPLD